MSKYFPFHAIGLQCNPFRTLTEQEWSELAVLPAACLSILEESEHHIQIIGSAGSGKSTLLRGIRQWYAEREIAVVLEYIAFGVNLFQTDLQTSSVFLLDEAQRLRRKEFDRLLRAGEKGTRLIWSSHKDLLKADHSKLKIECVHLRGYPPDHLESIIRRRIEAFSSENSSRIEISPGALEFLDQQYPANLRGMFDFLYEFFQTIPDLQSISAEVLEGFAQSFQSLTPPE